MKILGQEIPKLKSDVFVFEREGKSYPIVINPVNLADYATAYPPPKAPLKIIKGGAQVPDTDDAGYKSDMHIRQERLSSWIVLQAIKDTPGLEWKDVKYTDPESWDLYEAELKQFMTDMEIARLINRVMAIQGISDEKTEAARKHFLALLEAGQPLEFIPSIEKPSI